jgi:hypothetical protein
LWGLFYFHAQPFSSLPVEKAVNSHKRVIMIMQKKTLYKLLASSTIVATLTGTTVLAGHRYFNDRPAQNAAAQFFPANAMVVMIADIKPNSAAQILTFKRLSDALKATTIRPKVNEMREGMTAEMPLVSGIWPHLNRSVAGMSWSETRKVSKKITQKVPLKAKQTAKGKKTKQPKMQTITKTVIEDVTDYHYLTVLSIDDAKGVRKILDDNKKKAVDASGLHLVYLKDMEVVATTVGDYLLIADTATSLYKAVAVQSGRLPAMSKTPGFIDAQNHLPADANIFCYVAPQGIEAAQKAAGGMMANTPMTVALDAKSSVPATGVAWAMTIREEGLAIDARIPWKDTNTKRMQALSRLRPISADAYSKMPPGAMGVFALAQPSGYWDVYDAGVTDAKARKEMQDSFRDMEKELGMKVPQDLVAGLKGNLLVGVYPSLTKPKEVDVLVVADDNNGATPDALVAKLQVMIEKQNDDKPVFTQEKHGSDQFWRMVIEKTPEKKEEKSVEKTGVAAWESQMRYTTAGGAFQVATSSALLEQSLKARRGGENLLIGSPEYAVMRNRMVPGAQMGMLISPSAILSLFQEDILKGMGEGENKPDKDDILHVLGEPGKGGMVMSAGYTNGVFSSQFVLPINYERAMRLMQVAVTEMDKGDKESKETKPRIDTQP